MNSVPTVPCFDFSAVFFSFFSIMYIIDTDSNSKFVEPKTRMPSKWEALKFQTILGFKEPV